MNPETKKQTDETPDLSFILNDSSEQGNNSPTKRTNKKVVFLGILTALLLIILIGTAIFSSSKNVQREQPPLTSADVILNDKELITKFLNTIAEGKSSEAYDKFVFANGPLTKSEFLNTSVPFLERLNLRACAVRERTEIVRYKSGGQESYIPVDCPVFEGTSVIDFLFQTMDDGGTQKIREYRLRETI